MLVIEKLHIRLAAIADWTTVWQYDWRGPEAKAKERRQAAAIQQPG
jgi:hypothetical protein